MPFKKYVQVGRVALVNQGSDAGKLCVIVDVIDQNRVLIDGPTSITGVKRAAFQIKGLTLTQFVIDIKNGQRPGVVAKAFKEANILEAFSKTTLSKKMAARTARRNMTDFDRFKAMVSRQKRNAVVNAELSKLKKAAH